MNSMPSFNDVEANNLEKSFKTALKLQIKLNEKIYENRVITADARADILDTIQDLMNIINHQQIVNSRLIDRIHEMEEEKHNNSQAAGASAQQPNDPRKSYAMLIYPEERMETSGNECVSPAICHIALEKQELGAVVENLNVMRRNSEESNLPDTVPSSPADMRPDQCLTPYTGNHLAAAVDMETQNNTPAQSFSQGSINKPGPSSANQFRSLSLSDDPYATEQSHAVNPTETSFNQNVSSSVFQSQLSDYIPLISPDPIYPDEIVTPAITNQILGTLKPNAPTEQSSAPSNSVFQSHPSDYIPLISSDPIYPDEIVTPAITNQISGTSNANTPSGRSSPPISADILTSPGKGPYECIYCKKRFPHQSTLNNHIVKHTNERQFSCKYCSKKLKHQGALNNHLKICKIKKMKLPQ